MTAQLVWSTQTYPKCLASLRAHSCAQYVPARNMSGTHLRKNCLSHFAMPIHCDRPLPPQALHVVQRHNLHFVCGKMRKTARQQRLIPGFWRYHLLVISMLFIVVNSLPRAIMLQEPNPTNPKSVPKTTICCTMVLVCSLQGRKSR